ncbi:MAG: RnfABCDGE type electron transport complex subunit D [Bacteroidales bacterium]|nr:RnfABCDGE type electron transport complex subunit D [Bacteroidales bacterium]MDD3430761.1 RnfABCDGE type electron transport complex subunit D [Bacteroidales bacterium]MDD4361210.1 RnfABCDGE type electron transport complex subunit D [Bacteroidales bacterium]MDD4431281.1 RnfABCDGE type electron transport complex subunit D [Bacteroidales bacterium]
MENKLYVSMSPHIHSGDSISRKMWDVIIALIPALLVSLYFFGLGSLLVTSVSIASCVLFEYLIGRFLLKQESSIRDGSAILTGLLLAFNLPSNLPLWIVAIGALVAIGMAKMSFGGLGNNIFNPALVGRVFLLISFPQQMTSWPLPKALNLNYLDAATGATPLSFMKSGRLDRLPDTLDMFIGNTGGSIGEVATVALILGGLFLLIRKVISWHIPVSILLTVYIFTGILRIASPELYADPLSHMLTGGLMLGAVFMATDYVTSPMVKKGQVIYGVGIGIITVCIRVFGSYPEGVSFAILMMNGVTPLINAYCKPKRFGEVK